MKMIENTSPQRAVFGCWPKTHTAQQSLKHLLQTEAICAMIHITIDDWRALLFEAACRWVESKHADNLTWAAVLLQDAQFGFWAAWMQDWLEHDAELLQKAFMVDAADYWTLKEAYLKATDIIW